MSGISYISIGVKNACKPSHKGRVTFDCADDEELMGAIERICDLSKTVTKGDAPHHYILPPAVEMDEATGTLKLTFVGDMEND